MISAPLVAEANAVRKVFVDAMAALEHLQSLRAMESTSEGLKSELDTARELVTSGKLRQPFTAAFACAVVGSSNHGKTSILAEMFPDLERRGWLVTDVKDTTSQALVIRQPVPGSQPPPATVHSSDEDQIKRLFLSAEEANNRNQILVSYLPGEILVDGSQGRFDAEDVRRFRFGPVVSLRPFPKPYELTPTQEADPVIIRALTVKEEQDQVTGRPVLHLGERPYTALQLRAVIKDVTLSTPFTEFVKWSGRPAEDFVSLSFIDTPGLGVTGSIKDEVLRHVLENKSTQIVLELLRNDELDLIIHLVLCGESSQFARLWGAVERQCGPDELSDLSERLVLAINGFNRYFTNADLKRKWTDPTAAAREGDHFATSIDDNILKRMSERGTLRPARIVFIDSLRIVEGLTGRKYAEAYEIFRPATQTWSQPGGAGHPTLERLGLLATFGENVASLCDPDDRGQGFLVRQVLDLIDKQGARLFVRKALVRSKLVSGARTLRAILLRYYDRDGRLQTGAFRAGLHALLKPLHAEGVPGVEKFARDHLDAKIEGLLGRLGQENNGGGGATWVEEAFKGLCTLVYRTLATQARLDNNMSRLVEPRLKERLNQWRRIWGYERADLPMPTRKQPETAALVQHCLTLHARDILYQLLTEDLTTWGRDVPQDEEDRAVAAAVIQGLEQAETEGARICREHGVDVG
jgi:hypothetical protein